MPARMAGAAVFTEVVASRAAVFTEVVASMAAAFTPAHFTVDLADFIAAYGTVAQRASTMVSATATAATGTTAGEAGDTARGGVTGWEGITIRTTATTAPANPAPRRISYRRHRFPLVIIQRAVWLYLRFTLSYRDVEELLAERGLDISYETVRCWVLKFGTNDRATAPPSPSAAEHSLAPRRDGNPDCWRADVPLAGRRPRGRGPRHAGSAPTRQPGGAAADAQAAQEARLRPQIADHRQAALLRRSVPASATDLPA